MDITSFGIPSIDPFDRAGDAGLFQNQASLPTFKEKIHIRFEPGKRAITLIEGLDEDLDQPRIARAMKRAFKCAASVHQDKLGRDVIKLQGDHCMNVKEWLLTQEILTQKEAAERLVLHKF